MRPARTSDSRIYYSLVADDVASLWDNLRRDALRHRPERARAAYLGPEDTQAVTTERLLARISDGEVVVLDVRPEPEYASGHLPGVVHIPAEELTDRLAELPADRGIIAYYRGQYCVLAHDAVRCSTDAATGQPRHRRSAGVAHRWPACRDDLLA